VKKQVKSPECIIEVEFEVGGFMYGMTRYQFKANDMGSVITTSSWTSPANDTVLSHYETTEFQKKICELKTENWKKEYIDYDVLDGTEWKLIITYSDEKPVEYRGSNAYPSKWDNLVSIFGYEYNDD